MIGKVFGRLTVIERAESRHGAITWRCACSCGKEKDVCQYRLKSGHTSSCGCLVKDIMREKQTKHGRYYVPEFQTWKRMIARCKPDSRFSKWYGSVVVCEKWRASFDSFLADVGQMPSPLHSLDRIDPAGNYEPGNVRWADKATQSRNTKTPRTSKTGVRGVSWSIEKQKWRAAIYVNNVQKHLGYFSSISEAEAARKHAEIKYWR